MICAGSSLLSCEFVPLPCKILFCRDSYMAWFVDVLAKALRQNQDADSQLALTGFSWNSMTGGAWTRGPEVKREWPSLVIYIKRPRQTTLLGKQATNSIHLRNLLSTTAHLLYFSISSHLTIQASPVKVLHLSKSILTVSLSLQSFIPPLTFQSDDQLPSRSGVVPILSVI